MFDTLFHSVLLAQVFGITMVLSVIILLARHQYYRELISSIQANDISICIGAYIGLVFGVLLIIVHNIWVWDFRVVVTIVCWLIFIRSILWLTIPEKMVPLTRKVVMSNGFFVALLVVFCLGVFLMARGFYLHF